MTQLYDVAKDPSATEWLPWHRRVLRAIADWFRRLDLNDL